MARPLLPPLMLLSLLSQWPVASRLRLCYTIWSYFTPCFVTIIGLNVLKRSPLSVKSITNSITGVNTWWGRDQLFSRDLSIGQQNGDGLDLFGSLGCWKTNCCRFSILVVKIYFLKLCNYSGTWKIRISRDRHENSKFHCSSSVYI